MLDVTLTIVNGVLPVGHGDAFVQMIVDSDHNSSPSPRFDLIDPDDNPKLPTKFGIAAEESFVLLQSESAFNPENLPTQPSK